jgi:single-strand DNA-binding protein
MASLNRITLIGNVGGDPREITAQNQKGASFSLAVSEKYTKQNGESADRTEWFSVTFWGNTADIVLKYVKKGSQVYVDGRLNTREYTDKDGKNRTSLEVRGQTLTLLGSLSSTQGSSNTHSNSNVSTMPAENISTSQVDDDLPF